QQAVVLTLIVTTRQPLTDTSLHNIPIQSMLHIEELLERTTGGFMTPLEKVNSMKMPFAELKGVKFTEAELDRVVARMLVRPDLCTLNHTIHGGAIMALADSVGAAATVITLHDDVKVTTLIESKTNCIGSDKEAPTLAATATPV